MQRFVVPFCILYLLAVSPPPQRANAGTVAPAHRGSALEGLRAVRVAVDLHGDVSHAAPRAAGVQASIETRLRQLGLRIDPAGPVLTFRFVEADTSDENDVGGIAASLYLNEWVTVYRNQTVCVATVWESHRAGVGSSHRTKRFIDKVLSLTLDDFARDWTFANPATGR